jgi:DNA polymerase III epsilon subunit-like protein
MSRIRRLSFAIAEQGRRANSTKQALRLRDAVVDILEEVNQNTSVSRRVTKRSAFTVVLRSLQKTKNLPFSLREHMALKELSSYITLAQSNKNSSLTLSNTDLLPTSHPRSTREHSLTASAVRNARSRWFADDPRITDERAKTILSSAFSSEVGSVEHTYYTSVLSALPQGMIPTEALLAAFGDGNSSAARSARAQLQRRDREGKFAFQGGGLRALVRRGSQVFSLVGRTVADGLGDLVQIELPDGRIAQVPGSKGEFIKAVLPTPDGYSPAPIDVPTSELGDVINESDIQYTNSPEGWEKVEPSESDMDKLENEFSDGESVQKYADGAFNVFVVSNSETKKRKLILETAEGDRIDGFDNWADLQDALRGKEEELAKPKAQLPKEKESKFAFNYPEGAYKIAQGADYDVQGRQEEDSPNFTDDPAEIAQMFDERDLIQALEQAVLPQDDNENAFGYGVLNFNRGEEFVPAEALYKALDEAGEDADLELAKIYDKGLGSNDNEKALLDARKGPEVVTGEQPDVAESFERVTKEGSPDVAPAAEEPKFEEEKVDTTPLPAVLKGLTENELARFMESRDHTPHLPKNWDIANDQIPEGYNKLDPSPFQNWREITEDDGDPNLPVGFSDNPVFLAQNVSQEELLKEFRRALEPEGEAPGYGAIKLTTDDGEEFVANVPGEAIRDALQLQGVDTNFLTTEIYAEAGNLVELNDEDAADALARIEESEGELPPTPEIPEVSRASRSRKVKKGTEKARIPEEESPADAPADDIQAELPLDLPVEKKPMNAYERLMAEQQAEKEAVAERKAKLAKDAEARVDEKGRRIPEGWGIQEKAKRAFGKDVPENYSNVYGRNNFEAQVDKDGNIVLKDNNNILEPKTYKNWKELEADFESRKEDYAKESRKKIKDWAKAYGFSDEQVNAFDSMSEQEIADFFANPENHTDGYKNALDDFETSWAVDLPSAQQKARWSEFGKMKRLADHAGDLPDPNKEKASLDITPEQMDALRDGIKELDWLNEGILFAKRDGGDDRLPAQDGVIDIYDDNAVAGDLPIATIDADNNLEWRDEETKKRYEALVKGILDEDLEGIVQDTPEQAAPAAPKAPSAKKKTVSAQVPKDFEADSLEEIPEGFQEYPKPANVAPPAAAGGDGPPPPFRIRSKVKDLQPGDITTGDHFVITKIGDKVEGTNRIEIEGYYPGHVIQNTKQWVEDTEIEVIRGVQPLPEQGDLPVLSKPKMKDFGKIYKDKADNQWKFRDPEAQAQYDAAFADYNVQAAEAKKRFPDPTEPSNQPHRAIVRAADLKPGDVTTDPKKGHFVIERVFVDDKTKPNFVSVEGYYPGYGTQRKEWKVDTQIDVIRNVEAPAKGEGELHRPNKVVNGKWIPDKDEAKNAEHQRLLEEAGARWNAPENLPVVDNKEQAPEADQNIPNAVAVRKPARKRVPNMPAFQGEWAAIAREAGGDWNKFRELIKDKTIVFFDFETTGIKDKDGNEPWQVAGVKVRDGKIVDRFNIYMNPGRSVKDVWAGEVGKDGKPNAVDADGNPLSDEFLAKQPNQAEAMARFFEWAGLESEGRPLLAAHYVQFDDEVARRMADKHGLEYQPDGLLDTKAMGQDIFKNAPEKPEGNRLGQYAEFLGVELDNWHAADADAEALAGIFEKLIDKGIELDGGKDLFDVDKRIEEYEKALGDYESAKVKDDAGAADFAAAKAIRDALDGKEVKLDEVIVDAKNSPALDPEGLNMGPVDAPLDGMERRDDGVVVLDFTPNAVYPKGEMRMMPREWVLDDKNAVLLDREDARMRNILPGDFMASRDGNIIWQVTAVRAGEEFGLEPGRVKIWRRDIETGEMNTYEHWHGTRLDGVRRPINPADLDIPEGNPQNEFVSNKKSAPESEQTPEAIAGKQFRKVYEIGDKSAVVKLGEKDLGIFMEAELFDAEGNSIYKVDGQFRTFAGAEAEADALLKEFADGLRDQERDENVEPEEARAKDVPISRGDVPADAYDAPETIEVENLPPDLNGQISIRETGQDAPNYEVDAVLQNSDGDNLAEHHSEHPTKRKAEKEGRDFVARASDAIQNPEPSPEAEEEKPKSSKPKKEVPQDEKVKFSQLNEEEQAEVLRNVKEIEAIAVDMAGIKAEDVMPGDFFKHRQLGHYEKVIRIERGKEWGMDRLVFWVYNPIAGKEQPRPFKADSPLEFVRRVGGDGPVEKFPVGKARGRAKRPDIRRQDPLEKVVVREGRIQGAKKKDRGFFKGADGEPVLKGDVVIHRDPAIAAELGRGIIKRRVGDQVDEGKKVGGRGIGGKVWLDHVFVQWENEEGAANLGQGGRQIIADKLVIINDNPDDVIANLEKKTWRGGVAKPNRRVAGRENPHGSAPAAKAPEAPKAAPGMPEDIVKKTVKDLNGGQFELSLIKIDDVYEGAVIDKQNGNVQIVVRDKNEQNARVELARAGDYIQQAAAGDEAMNDGAIPNLDKVSEAPAPKSIPTPEPGKEIIDARSPGADAITKANLLSELKKMRLALPKARADVGFDRDAANLQKAGKQLDKYMRNVNAKSEEDEAYLKADNYELRQAIAYAQRVSTPLGKELAEKLEKIKEDVEFKKDAQLRAREEERQKRLAEPFPDDLVVDKDNITNENLKAMLKEIELRLPEKPVYPVKDGKRALEKLIEDLNNGMDPLSLDKNKLEEAYNGLRSSQDSAHVEMAKKLKPIFGEILSKQKERETPNREANLNKPDPAVLAEERIRAGENIVDAPNIKEVFAKDDVFAANPFLEPFKEELQKFFAPAQAQPLAKLSSEARQALNQYLSGALRDDKALVGATPDQTDKNIREAANLILALRAEELAFSPNRDNVGVAQGLKNIDPEKILKYGRANASTSFVPLIIDGVDTGFLIKLNENGVNARSGNNFWLIDTKTGQKIIIKKETMAGRANAEVWSAKLLNAFGVRGVSHVERHPQDDDIIFVTFAGDNIDLADVPNVYDKVRSKLRLDAKATAARAKVADLIGMMIFDGVASNTDRHEENFLAAETPENGVARNGNEDLQLLPIDHGYAHRLSRNRGGVYDPETLIRTNGYFTSREIYKELVRSIGGRAAHHLIDLTVQQAIQELKRDNGGIDPAVLNDILAQLDVLRGITPQKWAKDMGARE